MDTLDTYTSSSRVSRILAISIVGVSALVLFAIVLGEPSLRLLSLHFNPFAVLSGMTTLLMIVLLIFFASKPAQTEERIWLSFYIITVLIFAFGEMMQRLSTTPYGAMFWDNVSVIGISVPAALYLFSLAYTNQSGRRFSATTAVLLVGGGVLGFFYDFTDVIFKNDPSSLKLFPWGYDFGAPHPGIIAVLLFYYGLLGLSLWQMVHFHNRTKNPILRRQSMVFIVGMIFPVVLAVITDVVLPGAGIAAPKLGVSLEAIAACVLLYGVLRYQLLTISPTLFSHTILGIMQEAVVATDDKLTIIYQNPTAESLLGLSVTERHTTSLEQLLDSASASTLHKAIDSADTGIVDLDHLEITTHDRKVPVRLTGSRLYIGNMRIWVLVVADITDELKTRHVIEHEVELRTRELNEARAYLIHSIESLSQGFILINSQEELVLANTLAKDLLEISGDDLTGKPIAGYIAKVPFYVDINKAIRQVLDGHRSRRLHAKTPNGSFYDIYITPVTNIGQVLGAAIIIQDTTEQKVLERSKDEFFSIASHELRTPLTAIRGNMSMFKRLFPDALKNPSARGLIDDSHEAAVRLIGLVKDFLDSSQLEQGRMSFTLAPVNIQNVAEAVATALKGLAATRHNTITANSLASLPDVLADEARMHQILYNLVSNANNYSQNSTITISGVVEGAHVRLRITDTGKGIAPENQKLLFHKFQQANDSLLSRDVSSGTGLGLYIARLLATHMHGTVELEHTEPGKGSTFALVLPIAGGTAEAPRTKPHAASKAA